MGHCDIVTGSSAEISDLLLPGDGFLSWGKNGGNIGNTIGGHNVPVRRERAKLSKKCVHPEYIFLVAAVETLAPNDTTTTCQYLN